jgi:nitric oxide reductase NorQ protein
MIPTKRPYFISANNKAQIEGIMKTPTAHPVNLLIKGRHGMGKSECSRQIAATFQLDYTPVPIGSLQETGQLMGRYELVAGETKFVSGQFPKAVATKDSLIHLEELNRPESPKALNDLFPLLDDSRELVHEQLGSIKVADGVVFIATLNEGFEYTGIDPLDAALEDRFHIIHLDYLPPEQEAMLVTVKTGYSGTHVEKLLQFVNKLRHDGQEPIHVSTRRVLMMAELMQAGLDMQSAIIGNVALDKDKLESVLLHLDFQGEKLVNGNGIKTEFVVL